MAQLSIAAAQHVIAITNELTRRRRMYDGDKARTTAVNKAALNLLASAWAWTDQGLQVQSASNLRTFHHVTARGCSCPASGVCWHTEARLLLLAMGHGDDWQDDDSGCFVEDDGGFISRLEARQRVSPGEAAMERWQEKVTDADAAEYALNRDLGLL